MKVLLVDDNRLMLEGLHNLLEASGLEVAGTAPSGLEAVELACTRRPDVILMDVRMPGCDGLEATRRIKARWPEARIVMLTTSDDDDDLFQAIKSGACGYLLKSIDSATLVEALEQALQGTPPFSPGLANRLLSEFARVASPPASPPPAAAPPQAVADDPPGPATALNPRQLEVLGLVAAGLSYKEVGARLYLSPRTVKYHMAEILDRLHLENRAQVLALAGRMGWTRALPDRD